MHPLYPPKFATDITNVHAHTHIYHTHKHTHTHTHLHIHNACMLATHLSKNCHRLHGNTHHIKHHKATNCVRRCRNVACKLACSLKIVHVCLQINVAVQFARFYCFPLTILLNHWRFSGNLYVTTFQLAITFIYSVSVQFIYSRIPHCKNAQHCVHYICHR